MGRRVWLAADSPRVVACPPSMGYNTGDTPLLEMFAAAMSKPKPRTTTGPAVRPEIGAAVNAFRRILRALRLAETETRVTAGISAAQLFVLRALSHQHGASLSELAVRTLTDRSSVAAVVDRLLVSKLVTRTTDARDRRRVSINITAKGRAVLARAPQPPTSLLVDALTQLSRGELVALSSGLTALTAAMDLSDEPAAMLFEDRTPIRRRRSAAVRGD